MPAALAIPIIYGASKLGEAYVQHRAAGKAMDTQQAGANAALKANTQAYNTQQGLYQSMLGGASNTLSRLSTPGGGAQFAAGGPPVGQFSAPGMMPGAQNGAPGQRPSSSLGGFAGGMDKMRQAQGQAPMGQPAAPSMAPQGPPQGAQGAVTMRSPDGRMGQVPAHLVGQATAAGYQPMGGGPQMGGGMVGGLHNYGGGGEIAGMPQQTLGQMRPVQGMSY